MQSYYSLKVFEQNAQNQESFRNSYFLQRGAEHFALGNEHQKHQKKTRSCWERAGLGGEREREEEKITLREQKWNAVFVSTAELQRADGGSKEN